MKGPKKCDRRKSLGKEWGVEVAGTNCLAGEMRGDLVFSENRDAVRGRDAHRVTAGVNNCQPSHRRNMEDE